MTRGLRAGRPAFTLVELLVAMGVLVALASITLLVVPDIRDQDRTTDGAGLVRQILSLAKSRAVRDQAPRGVRLIATVDPANPTKGANTQWVTELQYTEAQNILPLTDSKTAFSNFQQSVSFTCTYDSAGGIVYSPPAQFLTNPSPTCRIHNLAATDAALIQSGCLLTLPTLGTSHRVLFHDTSKDTVIANPSPSPNEAPGSMTITVILDSFPQAQLGGAGVANSTAKVFRTTLFGITAPPQPLLGEPTVPLPKNICVDLASSMTGGARMASLPPNSPTADVDIMFLPNGQVLPTFSFNTSNLQFQSVGASNQIFLWVRDYTKAGGDPTVYSTAQFAQGGEQQVVAIKTKSGAVGTFPVAWVSPGGDPFQFARTGASSP